MLSILIPVYNYDVTDLVINLNKQAMKSEQKVEIILVDDKSDEKWKPVNRKLAELKLVKYEELSRNLGRSKVRNYLAAKSKFEFLLFLDNDMGLLSPAFIDDYLKYCRSNKVVSGGLTYSKIKPESSKILHWEVGRNREVKSVIERIKSPYKSFLSCNFLCPKSIFNSIKFDENIAEYGHEDTLFGMELKKRKIEILHIENSLEHRGLEDSKTFLKKTRTAVKNLVELNKKADFTESKLAHTSLKIKRLGLKSIFLFILKKIKPVLINNLESESPKLFYFDLYKLLIYLKNSKN